MGSFLRASITDDTFIKGAARVLYASDVQAWPTKISDVLILTAGGTQYDTQAGWTDLGATRGGVNITRNNTEETYEVDQIAGEIESTPTGWEMRVATQIAEVTPTMVKLAWEGGTITTDAAVTPNEQHLPVGQPTKYIRRRLAVAHKRNNDKIRLHVFRRVQRGAQESALAYAKTGEQQSIPVNFRCLADSSVSDENARFGEILDQV